LACGKPIKIFQRNKMIKVVLAIGGNLGDALVTFSAAIKTLEQNGLSDIVISPLYSNPAINCVPGTHDFVNSAIIGKWDKTPEELLILIQRTEVALGRPKIHRSETSRTLDIDIILFGNMIISTEKLIIPHPRAKERDFVLIPINEIAPDWLFPDTGKTINATLAELFKSGINNRLKKII
jgi:2-amino-4-hydroxy-6-hydroxymethyldihydropteridine diphosphokinase